jgi:hypothetical protein
MVALVGALNSALPVVLVMRDGETGSHRHSPEGGIAFEKGGVSASNQFDERTYSGGAYRQRCRWGATLDMCGLHAHSKRTIDIG